MPISFKNEQIPENLRKFFRPVERCGQCYICHMVRVFGLVRDCLADHGTLWLNVGDTYSSKPAGCKGVSQSSGLNGARGETTYRETLENSVSQKRDTTDAVDAGNLCLIPQRLMIALQDDGWIVRSVVVWHKPSPMPSSVAGWRWMRCRSKVAASRRGIGEYNGDAHDAPQGAHRDGVTDGRASWSDCPGCKKCEKAGGYVLRRGSWRPTSAWEPVIMLAKSASYYCDGEAVKTPAAASTISRDQYTRILDDPDEQFAVRHDHETTCDAGANARDVQTWASEPLKERHYAAYPTKLVDFCLRAGTSAKGYCPTCGKPWCRILEGGSFQGDMNPHDDELANRTTNDGAAWARHHRDNPTSTIGWRPSCFCPEQEPRPALVLDPFAGSGRTGVAANRIGLDFVGVELSEEYAEMSRRILHDQAPLFAEVHG